MPNPSHDRDHQLSSSAAPPGGDTPTGPARSQIIAAIVVTAVVVGAGAFVVGSSRSDQPTTLADQPDGASELNGEASSDLEPVLESDEDEEREPAVAGESDAPQAPRTASWEMLPDAPIQGRHGHSAVWTGSEMLVWGGFGELEPDGEDRLVPSDTTGGAAYDPAANRWRTLSPSPIQARVDHAAAWTGTEMLIWGGGTPDWSPEPLVDGAAYDPVEDGWRSVAPFPLEWREHPTVVWTGDHLLVWGGLGDDRPLADGALYHPETDSWQIVSASPLSPRQRAAGAWTGDGVIIWGGHDLDRPAGRTDRELCPVGPALRDGALYDVERDAWTPIIEAPDDDHWIKCWGQPAVWTGQEMLVFAFDGDELGADHTAAAYQPGTGQWRSLPPWPEARQAHGDGTAVWTGDRLLIIGGASDGEQAWTDPDHGVAYDPATDAWDVLPRPPIAGRGGHSALWTGEAVIIWGGTLLEQATDLGWASDGATLVP